MPEHDWSCGSSSSWSARTPSPPTPGRQPARHRPPFGPPRRPRVSVPASPPPERRSPTRWPTPPAPIAQAAVDSTTGSEALASVAYPGDLIVTAPGLVAGFSGGQTSGVVPPYPLIAVAGSTTVPESSAEGPGSSTKASADERQAAASATTGGTDSGSNATFSTSATVVAGDDDVVIATASSEADSVAIGPLVLGQVSARSVASRAPGAEVTRESSFEATGFTIAGTGVALTPDGLVVARTNTPVSASPLQPLLDAAGVSVQTVAQQETPDGIVSAGLIVTKDQDLPGTISPATVTYTFGRAAASVSTVSLPSVSAPRPAAPAAAPPEPAAPISSGGSLASPAATPRPTTRAASPSASTTQAPTELPIRSPSEPTGRLIGRAVGFFDVTTFYLVLVLAAACAGIVLELLRHLGVRLLWT